MRRMISLGVVMLVVSNLLFAGTRDLSGLKFCIDPGHGGYDSDDRHVVPDPGIDFWESESNFQKALLLKSLLEAQGATVILTRYDNTDPEPSLSARVAVANANNVDWFHSIHSNAIGDGLQVGTSIDYTLMLVREKRSLTDPAAGTGNGFGVPEQPESWTMANIMSPAIRNTLRTNSSITYLDWTFYGGVNGGFSLGVLRGLLMPGELSEGSMHDYAPETRRLMNNDYRKMEAYALRNSFMQYYGVAADTLCIIAGIQTDIGSSAPVNATQVRLLPENVVYTGDSFNNGVYLFDRVHAGAHVVRFETPGFNPDSAGVTIQPGTTTFVDRSLEPAGPPKIVLTIPLNADTAFLATLPIKLVFSKPMDVTSVQVAFSITPTIAGAFSWSGNNTILSFKPAVILPFQTNFTVAIDATAHSASGLNLDGNGDGVPGDPFILYFKTGVVDVNPPRIIHAFPANGTILPSPNHMINLLFDERLNPATVNVTNVAIKEVGGTALTRSVQYWEGGGKGGVNMYVTAGLKPGKSYLVGISGVADLTGNAIPNGTPIITQFSVASASYQYSVLDRFDRATTDWWQPLESGSTVGVKSGSFAFEPAISVPSLASDSGSASLNVVWDTTATDWLLREYLQGGIPKSVSWTKANTLLQVYVLGDGSGTQFRFAIDDSVDAFPSGRAENHEVSTWVTVDWLGWRLVEWDLDHDSVGTWVGNGKLEGLLRFDSFQLRYAPGLSSSSARIVFDQLQIETRTVTSVRDRDGAIPGSFALYQNYPNPFNPTTVIAFDVPAGVAAVTKLTVYDLLGREVRTLVDELKWPGHYSVALDASELASGVYLYRLESGSVRFVKKLIVLR
jgi:N-acetylmuramoyl-L-alanine amidase